MVRTIVQLTEEQKAKLEQLARDRDTSVSALVRQAVDSLVAEPTREEKWRRLLEIVGKYRDVEGKTDIGRRHDHYFAEAIEARWKSS